MMQPPDISEVVTTWLNPGATVLVIESWTLGALSQTAPGVGWSGR